MDTSCIRPVFETLGVTVAKTGLLIDIPLVDPPMRKRRHPNVIRAWLAGKIQKQVWRARNLMGVPRKLQPHNKT